MMRGSRCSVSIVVLNLAVFASKIGSIMEANALAESPRPNAEMLPAH